MQISFKPFILNKDQLKRGLFLLMVLAITFAIFQDFLHSTFNNYSFHFSESLLFKSFWLLFLPLLIGQSLFLKAFLNRSKRKGLLLFAAVLLPTALHIILFPIMVWLLSILFLNHHYAVLGTLNDTLAEDLYKYIFIYSAGALLANYGQKQLLFSPNPPSFLQKIVVNTGRNYVSIAVEEILFIDTAAPYLVIHTPQKTYLHTATLKGIAEQLDPKQFVRIHKSTIVNVVKVVSYKSRLNGDYDLLLSNEEMIRLSRNYAQAFKSQMS